MPDLFATEMVGEIGDSLHNSSANIRKEPRAPVLKEEAVFQHFLVVFSGKMI